jgi:hypothetical protein
VALSRHSGEYPFNKSNIVASHTTNSRHATAVSATSKIIRVNSSRRLPSCAKSVVPARHTHRLRTQSWYESRMARCWSGVPPPQIRRTGCAPISCTGAMYAMYKVPIGGPYDTRGRVSSAAQLGVATAPAFFAPTAAGRPAPCRYLPSICRASAGVATLSPSSSMIRAAFSTSAALLGASWPLARYMLSSSPTRTWPPSSTACATIGN